MSDNSETNRANHYEEAFYGHCLTRLSQLSGQSLEFIKSVEDLLASDLHPENRDKLETLIRDTEQAFSLLRMHIDNPEKPVETNSEPVEDKELERIS